MQRPNACCSSLREEHVEKTKSLTCVSASCKILNEDPSPANLSDGSACAFVQASVHSERQALDAAPATGHALTHDDSVDTGHTIDTMCRGGTIEMEGGGGEAT